MLGPTHYLGGGIVGILALEYLNTKGLLLPDVPFLIQCSLVYPMASYGSVFPDFDQSEDSMPIKSPMSKLVHKVLVRFGSSHRSWHTHAFDLWSAVCFAICIIATYGLSAVFPAFAAFESSLGYSLLRLQLVGFSFGLLSHIFLDSFTRRGTPSLLFPNFNLRFVPDTPTFSAGSSYEMLVRKLLTLVFWLLLFYECYKYFYLF